MKRSTRDLFKRLDDQRNSQPKIERYDDMFTMLYAPRPSLYPKGTVGYEADQYAISVEILIEQYAKAGIKGLTADFKLRDRHRSALLTKLKVLVSDDPINDNVFKNDLLLPEQVIQIHDLNEMLMWLSRDPNLMYGLPSRRFEEMVAKLFQDQGYDVSLTQATRDGGYDLMAVMKAGFSPLLLLVECKRYGPDRKVGVEVVRALNGVTDRMRANQGLIVTSSFFTRDASEEKRLIGHRMELKDYNDLTGWLMPYSQIRSDLKSS